MASLNAKAAALEAVEMVGKGVKVNYRSLLKKHGYSDMVARNPEKVTKTKSYQAVMQVAVNDMEIVRQKALQSLKKRDFHDEKAVAVATVVDIMTKNTQLLSGGSTANVGISIAISEHIADKYKDVPKDGSTEP